MKMNRVALLLLSAALMGHTRAVGDESADIQSVADWIAGLQFTDVSLPSYGAIQFHDTPGHTTPGGEDYMGVNPYFASWGVIGLLRSPVEGKHALAENWIDWYLSHLSTESEPHGLVLDHWYRPDGTGETTCPPGIVAGRCDHDDASDSYAALLLATVWTYHMVGGDTSFLTQAGRKEELEAVANVILELQQPDGLTWAKTTYPVKFLMDNSEVHWGLSALTWLERSVYGDNAAANLYQEAAARVRQGIVEELFDGGTSRYRWRDGVDGEGLPFEADFSAWYPQSVAATWPHLLGVFTDPSLAAEQISALNARWPTWTTEASVRGDFPWTSVGYAALSAGDEATALAHKEHVIAEKLPSFDYPFVVDDAGWLLRTLTAIVDVGEYTRTYTSTNLAGHLLSPEPNPGGGTDCAWQDQDVAMASFDGYGEVTSNALGTQSWVNAIGHRKFIETLADGAPVFLGTYQYRAQIRLSSLPFPDVAQRDNPEAVHLMIQLWDGRDALFEADHSSVEATIFWELNPWRTDYGHIMVYTEPVTLIETGISVTPDTEWHDFSITADFEAREFRSITVDGQTVDLSGVPLARVAHPEWGNEVAIVITTESLASYPGADCGTVFTWTTQFRDLDFGYLGEAPVPELTGQIPLDPGFNLIALGGPTGNDSITVITRGIQGNLIRVLGFETSSINPNAPLVGAMLYDPAVPAFVNSLKLVDFRLGYWFVMSGEDILMTGADAGKVATPPVQREAPGFADGSLHPVSDFMAIWGSLTVEGDPAPPGTVVEILDAEGTLAGRATVNHTGYYGFLPIYRDQPGTGVDEGAETREWLSIRVNGNAAVEQVRWTTFGDVRRLDLQTSRVSTLPQLMSLAQNYPNPFNPETTIRFDLPRSQEIDLAVYDLTGQKIATLAHGLRGAGIHSLRWDGRDERGRGLASGVYLYRLTAGDRVKTRKLLLLR